MSTDSARLMHSLRDLPLGHQIVSGCGIKATACAAQLLLDGVPRESIGIAATIVPDMSPEGMRLAYSSGAVMFKEQDAFLPYSFATRLAHHPGRIDDDRTGVALGATYVRQDAHDGLPGVRVGDTWFVPEPEHPVQFANHFAAVHYRTTAGETVPMVCDPGYDEQNELTVSEWKQRQNFPEAVVAIAPVGGPYRLHLEALSETGRHRLAALVGDSDATRLERRVASLSAAENSRLLREFANFPDTEVDDQQAPFYETYSRSIRDAWLVDRALPALENPEQALAVSLKRLAPLAAYEQWLHETDTRIRLNTTGTAGNRSATRQTGLEAPPRTARDRHQTHNAPSR